VDPFVAVFAGVETQLRRRSRRGSDAALSLLDPGLARLGFRVEHSKASGHRIEHYAGDGGYCLTMRIDARHEQLGIVVEVEGPAGVRGNAVYRDLIRASLIAKAKYLALAVPQIHYRKATRQRFKETCFEEATKVLMAIFAPDSRLRLPVEGVLLVGY
jgi:hypothetical protein